MSKIRVAKESDFETVLDLMAIYYAEDDYAFDRSLGREALTQLCNAEHLGRLWVLIDEGRVVGYMAVTLGFSLEYQGRDAFIDEIFIGESARSRGLGTMAMETAESFCRQAGVRALHLEVEGHREGAQALYQKRGFVELPRLRMSKVLT